MLGEVGTLVGALVAFISSLFSFNLYLKTRDSKSVWTEFGEMMFTASFLILLLTLLGLMYIVFKNDFIQWMECVVVILLPITIYYFYSTVIKIFKEFLGVEG